LRSETTKFAAAWNGGTLKKDKFSIALGSSQGCHFIIGELPLESIFTVAI
jgi:hypothetical protein